MIRPGAAEARISGVFEIRDTELAERVGLSLDQDLLPGDQLLITRKLFASGRSSLSVNGQPATAAMVRSAAEHLVDIHGQHDHQFLLKPSNQLAMIDVFAGCGELRHTFTQGYTQLRRLREQKKELSASRSLRTQQLDLYRFQAVEIDAVEPFAGEVIELQARGRVLNSLKRIRQDAGSTHLALYDSEGSIAERLQAATHVLLELAEVDETLLPIAEQVRSATLSIQESSFELGRYLGRLELDPAELEEIDVRLNALNRLIQKYANTGVHEDPITPVIAFREQIAAEITRLESEDHDLSDLDERIASLETKLVRVGIELSQRRASAADRLIKPIHRHLKELGMAEARLEVRVQTFEIDDSHVSPSGLDQIEILAQTNPGQEQRPLREIASGGEMSRIMLAIKSVFSGSGKAGADKTAPTGGVSVLVFDEVDANIGGRLGHVIGTKLRELAGPRPRPRSRNKRGQEAAEAGGGMKQVLCITHLPQIAVFGDRHFHIVKRVEGSGKTKQTRTTVEQLKGEARIGELAEMMAGDKPTATTRRQARELLKVAAA